MAVKCRSCALVYVNPMPDAADISEANKIGVHHTQAGELIVTTHRKPKKVGMYSRIVANMFREEIAAGHPMRWLDIGAGYGELVEAVSKVLPPGSHVEGIEPMAAKVAVADSLGLAITDTPLSQVEGRFDVISLINVFSHIPDFKSFLSEILDKLSENGLLLIETGNAADLKSRADYPDLLYLPDHLVFGGVSQIRSMLAASGFTLDKVRAARVDTPYWAAKVTIKSILMRNAVVRLPFTSPFRTVLFKARRNSSALPAGEVAGGR